MRRSQLIANALGGEPNTFITLTLPSSRAADAEQAVKDLARAWRLIRKRDARRRKAAPIPFLAVVERTAAGTPHLHIIARCKWIDQKWLSNVMDELVNAPIVDVRRIDNRGRVSGYVAKYCGKDSAKIGTNKRYWQSRDYNLKPKPADFTLMEGEFYGQPINRLLPLMVQWYVQQGFDAYWKSEQRCWLEYFDDI